jgi:hypothetical protein
MTNENRLPAVAVTLNDAVQVANVCRDRYRFVARPSLKRLQDAPMLAQYRSQRREIARGSWATMYSDERLGPSAILPHDEIDHRIVSSGLRSPAPVAARERRRRCRVQRDVMRPSLLFRLLKCRKSSLARELQFRNVVFDDR